MIIMLNENLCWKIWKWIVVDHDDVFFVVIVQIVFIYKFLWLIMIAREQYIHLFDEWI